VNGAVVGMKMGFKGSKVPGMEGVGVWAGDPFYAAANASLASLNYNVLEEDEDDAHKRKANQLVASEVDAPSVGATAAAAAAMSEAASASHPAPAEGSEEPVSGPPKPGSRMLLSEELRLEKGKLLTDSLTTGRNFMLSFNITPYSKVPAWSSIMRITKTNTDEGHHFDRMPSFFFEPGTTSLFASMDRWGVRNNAFVGSEEELPLGVPTQVTARLEGDSWSLSINGASRHIRSGYTNAKFPSFRNVAVWISDSFHDAADASVSVLNYTILPDSPPTPTLQKMIVRPMRIERGKMLTNKLESGRNFELSFDITPHGKSQDVTSILRLTKTMDNVGHYYDRMPAFFFMPDSLLMHVVMGREGKHEAHTHANVELTLKKTARIVARMEDDIWTLHVNGQQAGKREDYYGVQYPASSNVSVWVGDKFHPAALAFINELNYTALPEKEETGPTIAPVSTMLASTEQQIRAGTKLTEQLTTGQNFEISFTITPTGRVDGWSTVVRLTKTKEVSGHYFDRMPAFHFPPGSTELFGVMGRDDGHETYVASYSELQLGKSVQVTARLEGDIWSLSLDGKVVDTAADYCGRKYVGMKNVSVWLGDLLYAPSNASVSFLNYTILDDDISVADCNRQRNTNTLTLLPLVEPIGKVLISDPRRVQAQRLLVNPLETGPSFEVSFDIKPRSKQANMSSIFTVTKLPADASSTLDNLPSFFFLPQSTTIAAVLDKEGRTYSVSSPYELEINTTSRVIARLKGGRWGLSVNGDVATPVNYDGSPYPDNAVFAVYLGGMQQPPADAYIMSLNYTILSPQGENSADGNAGESGEDAGGGEGANEGAAGSAGENDGKNEGGTSSGDGKSTAPKSPSPGNKETDDGFVVGMSRWLGLLCLLVGLCAFGLLLILMHRWSDDSSGDDGRQVRAN